MLRVTPIYGCSPLTLSSNTPDPIINNNINSSSVSEAASLSAAPQSTLIEYGGVRILINVGWDESFTIPAAEKKEQNENESENIKKLKLPENIDVILITDSTLASLGGLPLYLSSSSFSTDNNNIPPIYGTFPTVKMGQMTLYDHHASLSLDGKNPGYTLTSVDDLFSPNTFQTLRYSQTLTLKDTKTNKDAISITPHRSGRVVGGSFFVLKRLADETEVVVAPYYHHAKERHLDSCSLHKYGAAADVLVTCPGGPRGLLGSLYYGTFDSSAAHHKKKRKPILNAPLVSRAHGEFVQMIMGTLRRNGNVLIPVDASGRVLELLLVLSQHWDRNRLSAAYNLCWVGPMAWNTIEFARSQLEWMASPLGAQFDSQRGHPYALKSVHICSSVAELDAVMEASNGNPTAVLASGSSLDCGPARDLLLKWAENPDNAIVLTDSSRCVLRGDVLEKRKQRKKELTPSGSGGGGGGAATAASTAAAVEMISATNAASAAPVATSSIPKTTTTTTTTTTTSATASTTAEAKQDEAAASTTEDETNLIGTSILPQHTSPYSTAAQLLLEWCQAKLTGEEMADVVEVDVPVPHRSPLAGEELRAFLAEEEAARREKKAEEERRAMLREVELAKGRLRLGEDEGGTAAAAAAGGGGTASASEGKADGKSSASASTNTGTASSGGGTASSATTTATSGSKREKSGGSSGKGPSKKKSRFDSNLFLKFSKPLHMTFEVREEAVGIGQSDSIAKYGIGESIGRSGEVLEDDYGIAVKPERFIDIVTGVDPSKFAGGSGRIGDEVLRRGLGFGSDGRPVIASGTSGGLPVALRSGVGDDNAVQAGGNDAVDGNTAVEDEQALEAADLSEGKGIIRGRNGRPPIKVSTIQRKIEVLTEVAYIPLEGRVDARAARQSVRALQPRQVVILGGGGKSSSEGTDDQVLGFGGEAAQLADAVRSLTFGGGKGSIFAPNDGETVELSVGHAAYSVRLIDTPYMTREEKDAIIASGEEIPTVEPYEAKMGECTVSLLDCKATGQKVALDGSIVLAPRSTTEQEKHRNVMLSDGDVLLTDLRSEVIAQGMKAEYSAHSGYSQLVVNGNIIVQKDQLTGKINVEGPLCEDFFTVRSVVCGQYVTL